MSACSNSICSIVGTRLMAVMRSACSVRRNSPGSKPGRITVRPPRSQKGSTNTPLAWISEAACSMASSGVAGSRLSSTLRQMAAYEACVCCAAFSVPVVPEVNSVSTTSSCDGVKAGPSAACEAACASRSAAPSSAAPMPMQTSPGTASRNAAARCGEIGPEHQVRAARFRQHARVLGQREPRVQRHAVDARLHAGEVQRHAVQAVVQQQRHARVRRRAGRVQRVREPAAELVDFGEGQCLVAEDDGGARAVLQRAAADQLEVGRAACGGDCDCGAAGGGCGGGMQGVSPVVSLCVSVARRFSA
jgi:hypothetical protein